MEVESLWRARLRWRLRGALLWPTFVLLTLLDAVMLGRLPIAGDGGTQFIPALLLGFLFNLVMVAVAAPFAAMLLRRRRPDLPKVVATDRAGTILVCMVTLGLLAGGLSHRSEVLDAQHDFAMQQFAARQFVSRRAPPEFRSRAAESDSLKLEEDLYRTCVPGDDPKRHFCVLVRTDAVPPGVAVDDSRETNAALNEPGGFR
jgi:hypothetical protein